MRAVAAIARNTFREALRDRVLYLFLGFAVALLVCSKLFGLLTVGDEGKVIKDFGLAGIQIFTMLIAVMMSVLLISREVDSRTVYNILAKPVPRWQFLIGKYIGLLATVAMNLALMTAVLLALTAIYLRELDPGLLFAAAMTLLEMALLTAFATLFAVLTRPMLGTVFTLAVFVIGHVVEDLWLLTQHVDSGLARPLIGGSAAAACAAQAPPRSGRLRRSRTRTRVHRAEGGAAWRRCCISSSSSRAQRHCSSRRSGSTRPGSRSASPCGPRASCSPDSWAGSRSATGSRRASARGCDARSWRTPASSSRSRSRSQPLSPPPPRTPPYPSPRSPSPAGWRCTQPARRSSRSPTG